MKFYPTELFVWLNHITKKTSKKQNYKHKNNLQLFRWDPEDLWGQGDQVDPVKHSSVSATQHLQGLILHLIVMFVHD